MIPAPRLDYNSLATPGGIGQGMAGLMGSILQARALQNTAAVKQQGLAQMEDRNARQYMGQQADRQERGRANLANEALRGQEIAARNGMSSLPPSAMEVARTKLIEAQTLRALRPPVPRAVAAPKPRDGISPEAYAGLERNIADGVAELRKDTLLHPSQFQATKNWFSPDEPAQRNIEDEVQAYTKERRETMGLNRRQPCQGGQPEQVAQPAWVAPAPAASATGIRARITALYGGMLDPDTEQSVLEAEEGDPDALEQLEEMLQGTAPAIAPQDPNDLLGQ